MGPETLSFSGLFRATHSAAGAEPPSAADTKKKKKGPGVDGGDAARTEAALSVPRLGTSQPKRGDWGPAVRRLLVL